MKNKKHDIKIYLVRNDCIATKLIQVIDKDKSTFYRKYYEKIYDEKNVEIPDMREIYCYRGVNVTLSEKRQIDMFISYMTSKYLKSTIDIPQSECEKLGASFAVYIREGLCQSDVYYIDGTYYYVNAGPVDIKITKIID